MDSTHGEDHSGRESGGETPTKRSPKPELNAPTTSRTMGEINTEVQDLRRENFNLKLRIFFLEEQTEFHDVNTATASSTLLNRVQHRRRSPSQFENYQSYQIESNTNQAHPSSVTTIDNQTIVDNEEMRKLRAALAQCREENVHLRRSSGNVNDNADNRLVITPGFPNTGSITPANNTSIIQFEDRERQFREQIKLLTEELKRTKEQHQADIQKFEQQRLKADSTLRRLSKDFQERLAAVEEQQSHASPNYEAYQHEPLRARIRFFYPLQGQMNSDVNVDEYHQKIAEQQHHIEQLNRELQKLRNFSISHPNGQITHDQDQLRKECEALRRTEQHLRGEIDKLIRVLNPQQPPITTLVPSITSSVGPNGPQSHDSKTVVDQTTERLEQDTNNISDISTYVTQLKRKYDESQRILQEKDEQIQKYENGEDGVGYLTSEKYQSRIRELEQNKKHLENRYHDKEQEVRRLTDDIDRLRPIDSQYTSQIQHLKQQVYDIEEQNGTLQKRVMEYQRDLNRERDKYNELTIKYEDLNKSGEVQRYRDEFERVQYDLERERNQHAKELTNVREEYERQLTTEVQKLKEFQKEYDRLQELSKEHEIRYNTNMRDYERQIEDLQQRRNSAVVELQQENRQLTERINACEVRCQNYKNNEQRLQDELNRLQEENRRIQHECDRYIDEAAHWKSQHDRIDKDFANVENDTTKTKEDNRSLEIKNTNLEHEIQQLRIRINVEIPEQYENKYRERYRDLNSQHQQEIQDVVHERNIGESKYKQAQADIIYLEQENRKQIYDLEKAKLAVQNYERKVADLEKDLYEEVNRRDRHIQDLEIELAHMKNPHISSINGKSNSQPSSINYTGWIAELEEQIRLRDEFIKNCKAVGNIENEQPDYVQLELRIHINQIEQDFQTYEYLNQKYTTPDGFVQPSITRDEREIDGRVERFQLELQNRDKRFDDILKNHNLTVDEYKQLVQKLQANINRQEEELYLISRDLDKERNILKKQDRDFEIFQQKHDRLINDQRNVLLENEELMNRIKHLEVQLAKMPHSEQSHGQIEGYERQINDLINRLEQSKQAIQNHERTHRRSEEQLNKVRQEYNELERHYGELQHDCEQMKKKLTSNIENLKQELSLRQEDLHKSEQLRIMAERRLDELLNNPQNDDNLSAQVVLLRGQIKEKDQEIDELTRRLQDSQRDPSDITTRGSTLTVVREPKFRPRPNLDHLNREELLFELEQASQHIQQLNRQLNEKSPSITELHNQIVQVRNELGRQQYVNQVLWRKLNAIMDIHDSTTRSELLRELANYQDELLKLKTIQSPPSSPREDGTSHVNAKEQQIQKLQRDLHEMTLKYQNLTSKSDMNDELRELRHRCNLLETENHQLSQYEQRNQKLRDENDNLRRQLQDCQSSTQHYTHQIDILQGKLQGQNGNSTEMTIRTSELSQLLEEIRKLRRDLERSIGKQNELQAKLDENIRQSRSPRSFKFSGRGVSYPDLHVIDASGLVGTEQLLSSSTVIDEQRSRLVVSSATDFDVPQHYEREIYQRATKPYVVGEVKAHNELRRTVEEIKFDIRTAASELQDNLQSRSISSATAASNQVLEEHLKSFDERLIHALNLIETFRQTYLPEKDERSEHPFIDDRFIEENKNLLQQQRKYIQIIQRLKEKYKQHSEYIDQLLAQITSNQH